MGDSIFPEALTTIESYAFYGNIAITKVVMSNKIQSIGSYAFNGCTNLISVESTGAIDQLLSIGSYAFYGCTALSSLFGEDGEAIIPNGVETIGSYAFANATSIKRVVVPNTVTSMGDGAFKGCTALTDITIPFVGKSEDATENYQKVFGYIFGNKSTSYVSESYTTASYDCTYQGISGTLYYIPRSITKVTITKQTEIPANAFRNCDLIETIVLPTNTTSIGAYAFCNCKKVASYNAGDDGYSVLPSTLTSISNYAFSANESLTKVVVSSNIENIGSYAFRGCTKLTEVIANAEIKNLTTIGSYAFYDCAALSKLFNGDTGEIIIPVGVETIGSYAFSNLTNITKVVVPTTVTSIGDGAFKGCLALSDITIPFVGKCEDATENYQKVFGYIFGVKSTSYSSDSYVTSTYDYTYQISGYVYYIPRSITTVAITKQTQIPANAFRNCDLIESVTIPNNATSIGNYAFYKDTKLTSINVPAGCSIGTDAFVSSGLLNKTGIIYIGSVLYKYNGTMPSGYTLKVKDGTTAIQANAFSGCSGLATLILPEGLKSIGANAFKNCTSLTEVDIPSSVESIGSSAFYGCSALKTITIPFVGTSATSNTAFSSIFSTVPTTLTTVVVTGNVDIPDNAFKNCTKITSITFTGSVGKIGANAFNGCSALTTLSLSNTVTSIGNYAFSGCTKLTAVDMSKMTSLVAIGSYAFQNCSSITAISVPESVTTIGDYTFSGCTKLTTANLSSKTTDIGTYAFNGCAALTTLTLNSNVLENIGAYAFQNCSALTTIYIPASVETIGEYAFNGCTALTINCEATSLPTDWDYNWNPSNCKVNWGK